MLIAIPLGLLIGLVVGAVGGGAAILALPVLVYALGQPVGPASSASLVVVAVGAVVAVTSLSHRNHVCWRVAFAFSVPSVAGSLVGGVANAHVGGTLLIAGFVPLMLLGARATWRRARSQPTAGIGACPPDPARRVAGAGAGVGLLTGLFGVGGGFLVVPVLTARLGLGFRRAVATSLVIIAVTATAGLVSHLLAGAGLDLPVALGLALPTAAGALVGAVAGRSLPQAALARVYAVVVTVVAVLLLVDVAFLGGPPGH